MSSIMGKRIHIERVRCGLTMEELGNKLGVTKQSIHKYESGIVENIPRSAIVKMAEIFGVSETYLMGWDEEDEINELRESLRTQPGMRVLFDTAKDATPEELEQAVRIIKALKGDR